MIPDLIECRYRELATSMPDRDNPYLSPGRPPKTRNSVVAVLDVLGFLETMRAAYESGGDQKLLADLRRAMDSAYENFRPRKWSDDKPASWYVKAFTDNIVIGYPLIFSDAEAELGSVLLALREYQLEMVNNGFFVRGGVAIGQLYMDNEIVFGNALLEAYQAEQNIARDPRVVIAQSARGYVKKQFGFYAVPSEAPHNEVLLEDADEQLFVNYLGATFDDDPQHPMLEKLGKHRHAVEAKLAEFRGQPPIWSKYAWVGGYHNFICQEQKGEFLNHVIDSKMLRLRPTRIYG